MLGDKEVIATVAVMDLQAARKFYEDTLGLKLADLQQAGGLLYKSGSSTILVYESKYAGTNKATAITWPVGDVEGVVRDLKSREVTFEHYDLPDTTRQGDIHIAGRLKIAWFKDPDGNIHSVASE